MGNVGPCGEAPALARRQKGGVREELRPEPLGLWC